MDMREALGRFKVDVSLRQSAVLAGVGLTVLLALSLLWLSMSTRTAMLNAQIEKHDAKRLELEDQINQRWRQLGDLSQFDLMSARAERLGFQPVDVEFLVLDSKPMTETVK